jgi:hypothetical protein
MSDKARIRKLKLFKVSTEDDSDGWEVVWAFDTMGAVSIGVEVLGKQECFLWSGQGIKVTYPRGFRVRDYNPPSEPGILKESSRKEA